MAEEKLTEYEGSNDILYRKYVKRQAIMLI